MRSSRAAAAVLAAASVTAAFADTLEKERRRGLEVLRDVRAVLERRYHDPSFGGNDPAARFARAEEEVRAAASERMAFGIVARVLADLDDSHTYFVPPAPAAALDFGWMPRMIGDRCFIVDVRPGTDAAAQGLRAGDEVMAIEGARPERSRLWATLQLLRLLARRPEVTVSLRGSDGANRTVTVGARAGARGRSVSFHEYLDALRQRLRGRPGSRFAQVDGVLVWKLAGFDKRGRAVTEGVERARRSRALVLDLRGNGGGDAGALRRLAGAFLDDDAPATIAWLRARRQVRPLRAERWPARRRFAGPLVVVVDSDSASAAEVFARTVQLRRRGIVVGDRTAGAVMLARTHVMTLVRDYRLVPYAVSVSEAAVVMPDGATLEKVGLAPDETALPLAEDLRAGRDPVLARAVALAGGELTPEAAGGLFSEP